MLNIGRRESAQVVGNNYQSRVLWILVMLSFVECCARKEPDTMRRLLIFLALAMLPLAMLVLPHPASAQRTRCFNETGYCVSDPILGYWERNGGLAVFGYPITDLRVETVEGTWTGPVQWFERDRLEDHGAEGVMAGRLGAQILELQGRPWTSWPQVDSAPRGCRYFPMTGHSVCPPFIGYWEQNGGLERFGYPITEAITETNADGWTARPNILNAAVWNTMWRTVERNLKYSWAYSVARYTVLVKHQEQHVRHESFPISRASTIELATSAMRWAAPAQRSMTARQPFRTLSVG